MGSELSRRRFLGGVLSVAAAATVLKAPALSPLPRIWGDGVHDDWAGLQAALDGKPFLCEDAMVLADESQVLINRGIFYISKTLDIKRPFTGISNSILRSPADPVLRVTNEAVVHIRDNTIEMIG